LSSGINYVKNLSFVDLNKIFEYNSISTRGLKGKISMPHFNKNLISIIFSIIFLVLSLGILFLLALTLLSIYPRFSIGTSFTTYFVDCENGNDLNNGLSPDTAWKTISKVNSFSFKAGDKILFKRGCVWRETLIVSSSGEEGNPITFGAYGEGERPRITGADIVENWIDSNSDGVWKHSEENEVWVLLEDGEKLTQWNRYTNISQLSPGEWMWKNGIIYYRPSWGTPFDHIVEKGARNYAVLIDSKSHIKIENLRLDVSNLGTGEVYERAVIYVKNSSDIEIVNNEVFYGRTLGIGVFESHNCEIVRNEVKDCGARGINIAGDSWNIKIAHNKVHHMGAHPLLNSAGIARMDMEGIAITGPAGTKKPYNIIIEYNEIYENGNYKAENSNKGKGICIWSGSALRDIDDVTIRYNRIYNNYALGISLESLNGNNFLIHHNLIYGNGKGKIQEGWKWGGIFIHSGGEATVKVYHNIFWKNIGMNNKKSASLYVPISDDTTLNLELKNNIFGLCQNCYEISFNLWGGILNLTSDYNLFYRNSSDDKTIRIGNKIYDFAHIIGNQAGYYSYEKNQDINSLTENPLFVDESNFDFHLKPDSPCIDAGIDVRLTQDFDGNAVPQGLAPDIGAYEYPQFPLPGDLNQDNKINSLDFQILIQKFKETQNIEIEDLNSDGIVDIKDIGILMHYWNP